MFSIFNSEMYVKTSHHNTRKVTLRTTTISKMQKCVKMKVLLISQYFLTMLFHATVIHEHNIHIDTDRFRRYLDVMSHSLKNKFPIGLKANVSKHMTFDCSKVSYF